MSRMSVRRSIDFGVFMVVFMTLWMAGAGWWALVIYPAMVWNYYDGRTRHIVALRDTLDSLSPEQMAALAKAAAEAADRLIGTSNQETRP